MEDFALSFPVRVPPSLLPRRAAALALAFAALAGTALPAAAQTRDWLCAESQWTQASCWSASATPLPASTETAAILSGAAELTGITTTVNQLTLGNGMLKPNGDFGAVLRIYQGSLRAQTGNVIDGAWLMVDPFGTFANGLLMTSKANSLITVSEFARLDVGPGGLLNQGALSLKSTPGGPNVVVKDGGLVNGAGDLGNVGTITVTGQYGGSAARIATAGFNQDGLLGIEAGAHLVVDNADWSSRGRTELQGVNASTGEPARLDGSRLYLLNGGELAGGGHVGNAVTVIGGTLRPGAGQDLVLFGAVEVLGPGTIHVDGPAGARLFFYGNASFNDSTFREITGGGFTGFGRELRLGTNPEASRLAVRGGVALQITSDLFMRLGEGGLSDALSASNFLLLEGGRLTLTSLDGAELGIGETFQLFPDTPLFFGSFGQIAFDELSLASGARLDVSRLYLDGGLSVVAVPEPATWLSLGAGLLLIGARARRRLRSARAT